jgi:hypothetical protein
MNAFTLIPAAMLLAASASGAPAPRRLDEIMIEGEVRLPQVLFITSRESRRPLDWLDHYAPPSSAEVAATTVLPSRIDVIPSQDPADVTADPDASAAPNLPTDAEDSTMERQR